MTKAVDLEADLEQAVSTEEKIRALNSLAEALDDVQLDRSLQLFQQAETLARAHGEREGLVWALAGQAKLAGDWNRYEEMSRLSLLALEEARGMTPSQATAYAQIHLAWYYFYLGEYSTGLEWGLRALETARAAGAPLRRVQAADVVASIYSVTEDHTQALVYHAEALRVVETAGDEYEIAVVLNNAAMSYMSAGQLHEALEHGRRGLDLAARLGMSPFLSNYYDTVAQVYLAMGKVEAAEGMLRTGLSLSIAARPDYLQAAQTKNLGKVCLELGKYEESAELLHSAISDFEQLGMRGEQARCYLLLSQLNERLGNFALALQQYKSYDSHREATMGKDVSRRMNALRAGYDLQLAQRDAEIERLRNIELQNEIEERRHIQAALEQLATVDSLTGLNNRAHFFVLAERAVQTAQRQAGCLAGMMIDLDHFKQYNDQYGHIAGDQILMTAGALIRRALGEADICGRYGGDEFTVLLTATTPEDARQVAERIRAAIAEHAAGVTASIGISHLSPSGADAPALLTALLSHADDALYRAKRAGGNAVHTSSL